MIPTRPASAALLAAASAILLTSCAIATTAPAPAVSAPPAAAEASERPADVTGWKVVGGGSYVRGTTIICSPDDKIYLEDTKELQSTNVIPVTTMVLFGGEVGYGTVWPNDRVTTGVTEGTGTYTMTKDSSGAPTAIHGTGSVTWHDATGPSTRPDTISLTFTPVPNPPQCAGD